MEFPFSCRVERKTRAWVFYVAVLRLQMAGSDWLPMHKAMLVSTFTSRLIHDMINTD
ncbi:hypothetical protein BRO54_3363 [Geobacillus proteiniphilus]|uniref:Uncharacterized protein n=1 Tax=Geobacillus proteiniphilus TaxID=860353 RepID=A0A1Q5SMY3_9BACL|nr:hypothetical protein BRO54_3363 [Geobacillus proteiniphilus]